MPAFECAQVRRPAAGIKDVMVGAHEQQLLHDLEMPRRGRVVQRRLQLVAERCRVRAGAREQADDVDCAGLGRDVEHRVAAGVHSLEALALRQLVLHRHQIVLPRRRVQVLERAPRRRGRLAIV